MRRETQAKSDIFGISPPADTYCNDFVCDSSPQIAETIRSYITDISSLKTTMTLYQPKGIDYSDGYRSVTASKCKVIRGCTMKWINARLRNPKTKILGVQMASKSRAEIKWGLSGSVSGAAIDVTLMTSIEMHQLTGRIAAVKESSSADTGMPAASTAVLTGSRLAWAASQLSLDVQEEVTRVVEQVSASLDESLGSMDDSDPTTGAYRDPTDPTKFFQNNQGEQNRSDMVIFLLIMSGLWAVYQGFSSILVL